MPESKVQLKRLRTHLELRDGAGTKVDVVCRAIRRDHDFGPEVANNRLDRVGFGGRECEWQRERERERDEKRGGRCMLPRARRRASSPRPGPI